MYSLTLVHENRISFGDENTSIVSSRSSPTPFRNDFAAIPGYAAREIWIDILKEGQQLMKEQSASSPRLAAVEVGANDSEQAVEIAKNGLESHSIEPSPKAFAKIIEQVKKLPADITDKIFLYNAAAGDSGEGYLNFSNSGSTGASVLTDAQAALIQNKDLVAKVKSITMEQVLNNEVKPDYNSLQHSDLHSVFATKIDVQGFEPKVFQGMKKAIQNHKIDFILTEWWPKGVNKMNGYSEQCGEALQYLYLMADAGYTLYATHIVGHPREAGYMEVKRKEFRKGLPFSDIKLHCLELYKLEVKFQLKKEAMGFWTDVLAVAPNAKLPRDPVSNFGRTIKKNMEESSKL
jgi:FkbM family methyltransferase